jgi:cytochrome c553
MAEADRQGPRESRTSKIGHSVRSRGIVVGVALAGVMGLAAIAGEAPLPPLQKPEWAYSIPPAPPTPAAPPAARLPGAPPPPRDQTLHGLPGTQLRFTMDQVNGRREPGSTAQVGPADWFPTEHPAMPPIVAYGDPARGVTACALCHYPSGKGRSENASLAGYPQSYLVQQLRDMRAGLRHSAEPRKANAAGMVRYAAAMTDAEIEASAAYYASMPWSAYVQVVESRIAPKVRNAGGLLLPLQGAEAGMEPFAGKIMEVAADPERTELRDPHSGFIAYVPVGSLAKGRALVTTGGGGRTVTCGICHGEDLNGLGPIPGLAGRSPSYIGRQLNDLRQGTRRGPMTPLMARAVAKLTDDDILNIAAYLASLPVGPPQGGAR